ncbi:hypothetical protein [Acidovorax sp. LjRoot117]|jgi:hypothetical protein|uniref:hypothetical protein n=1 Tax=Acidovorax sp. LjRoot117 TaxID=3342255 RepID=UPI003ECF040E
MLNLLNALLHLIVAVLLPLLGLLLTSALLIYAMYVRWVDIPNKWLLTRRGLVIACAVAAACNLLLIAQLFLSHSAKQARQDGAVVRASREKFVLPQDFQYGELLIPAGSLINRNDPFDKGAPGRPLALYGLEAVRFAEPVQVASVWASALQVVPMRVELAQDQQIGPLYRYDNASQAWVPHKLIPAMACKKGQLALFQVPHIPYDVQAEVGKPAPDGPDARFIPSQWLFRGCENGPAIAVQPAYSGPATATQ